MYVVLALRTCEEPLVEVDADSDWIKGGVLTMAAGKPPD